MIRSFYNLNIKAFYILIKIITSIVIHTNYFRKMRMRNIAISIFEYFGIHILRIF